MQYRELGRSGLSVSILSLGSGGPKKLGQSDGMTQIDQTNLVRRALDLGVNLIDTSTSYGDSEIILGNALMGVPRERYHLSTKWVPRIGGSLVKDPQALIDSVEKSLRRLRTDHIEIMLFHSPMANEYRTVIEQFYPTMDKMREQGKFRLIGISTSYQNEPRQTAAEYALKTDPELWDVIMLKYGILNQFAAKEMLPLALKHGIGIMNMAPVRVKLPDPKLLEDLISKWKNLGYISNDSVPTKNPLGWLIHDDVNSVVSGAYKFSADHPAISTVITGTSSISHLENNVAALDKPSLAKEDSNRLKGVFGNIVEYV